MVRFLVDIVAQLSGLCRCQCQKREAAVLDLHGELYIPVKAIHMVKKPLLTFLFSAARRQKYHQHNRTSTAVNHSLWQTVTIMLVMWMGERMANMPSAITHTTRQKTAFQYVRSGKFEWLHSS